MKNLCSKLCLSRCPQRPRRKGGVGKDIKNLCALCASVRNFLYLPRRFRSHGDHRGHGGGAEKALKNLCSKLCLSRCPQRPRRKGGVGKDIKTSVPSVPPCETLYPPMPFSDLAEITKAKERGACKDIKTSVRNSLSSHAVFRSHGVHKGQGEGAVKDKKPLCPLCLCAKFFIFPTVF